MKAPATNIPRKGKGTEEHQEELKKKLEVLTISFRDIQLDEGDIETRREQVLKMHKDMFVIKLETQYFNTSQKKEVFEEFMRQINELEKLIPQLMTPTPSPAQSPRGSFSQSDSSASVSRVGMYSSTRSLVDEGGKISLEAQMGNDALSKWKTTTALLSTCVEYLDTFIANHRNEGQKAKHLKEVLDTHLNILEDWTTSKEVKVNALHAIHHAFENAAEAQVKGITFSFKKMINHDPAAIEKWTDDSLKKGSDRDIEKRLEKGTMSFDDVLYHYRKKIAVQVNSLSVELKKPVEPRFNK